MKKLTVYLSIILCLWQIPSFATHYMGGEITWKCRTNGKYDFYLKLYRECNGITYSSSETINTTCAGVTSINMSLVSQADLSPTCYSANPSIATIKCFPSPTVPNTGAIEEWLYSSLSSYPNGVTLSGVPPQTGWVFSHNSCCRNPCTNINSADAYGWYLRAIMYPYQGRNANPCYDSSPVFAEKAVTVLTNNNYYCYNHVATDTDKDSLAFEWAQPLSDAGINYPLNNYNTGYSYNNPLPTSVINPGNISASMNPFTGETCFKSYTTGSFVNVTKVSSFRCGIKVAEIFREIQMVIIPDPYPIKNTPPFFEIPLLNYLSNFPNLYVDTVTAGELLEFLITVKDTNKLQSSNIINQTIKLQLIGSQFSNDYTSTSNCEIPPCATLNPVAPVVGSSIVSTTFRWQTACNHYSTDDCGNLKNIYYFTLEAIDNACPAPAKNFATIKIVVLPCNTAEINFDNDIKSINIYPNPISNLVNITNNGKSPSNFNLMVYNSLGNKMFQQQCSMATLESIEINTSSWNSGVYLISISNNKGIEYRKIIKL